MPISNDSVRIASKKKVAVGVVKCPTVNRVYGVRVEQRTDKKWIATWAFPIKPEAAKREGYTTNQFPPDLLYDKKYPGCPYCKKRENLAEITKRAARKQQPRICVSSPAYDNIGQILDSMEIQYDAFTDKNFDCDILFLNCATRDAIDARRLETFVKEGGCLYASDFTADIISVVFPEYFEFAGHIGDAMNMTVDVTDRELKEIAGSQLTITFDLSAWVLLNETKGEILLRASAENSPKYANKPIMVKTEYGKGVIFYTSFHNHAQASEREKALLQLLLLKQFGAKAKIGISEAGAGLGVNIDDIKSKFNFNW